MSISQPTAQPADQPDPERLDPQVGHDELAKAQLLNRFRGRTMDPLSAVSLAGTLVTFVETGLKVVSTFREISSSASGVTKELRESEHIVNSLQAQIQSLRADDKVSSDWENAVLLQDCSDAASDLTRLLASLRPKRNSILEKARVTARTVQKSHQIKDLESRLFKIRDQIVSRLIGHIFVQRQQLSAFFNAFVDADSDWKRDTETRLKKSLYHLEHLLKHNGEAGARYNLSEITERLDTIISHIQKVHRTQSILQSLHFEQIQQREWDIADAHRETFEWAFRQSGQHSFARWLENEDRDLGIYWIAGKAGSGKSTLTKFLSQHSRTRDILHNWAGSKNLLIASHFFWGLGVPLQRTQEGLFRTLLFQVLMKFPGLIPLVCRRRYEEVSFEHLQSWSRVELIEAFRSIARLREVPLRICFFIDGLDEYKGDHTELVDLLKSLSKSPDIKICASSRPWIDFLDAFDSSPWKLYVQDLTGDDIRLYVHDYLESDPKFQGLRKIQPDQAVYLISEVTAKAQGVFLWVFLVVRDLLRGLKNLDTIGDLQRRLMALPADLEPYFQMMIDSVDSIYRQRAAKVFKILLHCHMTLPVLTFWFLDHEETDSRYALRDASILPKSEVEIRQLIQRRKVQLIAQCRDLLYLSTAEDKPYTITERAGFLHRTVADFLRSNGMEEVLDKMAGPDFDARLSLSKAYLAEIKSQPHIMSFPAPHTSEVKRHVSNLVLGIIFYAHEDEISGHQGHRPLLNELENHVFSDFTFSSTYPITIGTQRAHSLVELAAQCGLDTFVLQNRGADSAEILRIALRKQVIITNESDFRVEPVEGRNVGLVRKLLEAGASPNAPLSDSLSVWEDFIITLELNPFKINKADRAYDLCSLLLSHGADPNVKVKGRDLGTIFYSRFEADEAIELKLLVQKQQNMQNRTSVNAEGRSEQKATYRMSLWGLLWNTPSQTS